MAVQRRNNTAVIKALIAAGANPSGPNPAEFGCLSPLLTAASVGDLDNLRDLLSAGASIERRLHCPMVEFTIGRWKPSVIDLLVQHGLNVQDVNEYGRNVLHLVLWKGVPNPDTIEYLIRAGVPVNGRDHAGKTPLAYWREPRDFEQGSTFLWILDHLHGANWQQERERRANISQLLERSGATL
jgi:ankyrin repeat protein